MIRPQVGAHEKQCCYYSNNGQRSYGGHPGKHGPVCHRRKYCDGAYGHTVNTRRAINPRRYPAFPEVPVDLPGAFRHAYANPGAYGHSDAGAFRHAGADDITVSNARADVYASADGNAAGAGGHDTVADDSPGGTGDGPGR